MAVGPTEEDIAVVLLNVYGIPVELPPTYLYVCHRSVLLLALVRETSFRSEWWFLQRLTIGLSAEKK